MLQCQSAAIAKIVPKNWQTPFKELTGVFAPCGADLANARSVPRLLSCSAVLARLTSRGARELVQESRKKRLRGIESEHSI